jgi:hypothetical protein
MSLKVAEAFDNVRVFAQGSLVTRTVCPFRRTGRIEEDFIKQDPFRKFLTLIAGDKNRRCPQPIDMGSEDSETTPSKVIRYDDPPVLHELGEMGCLAPGRSTEVKDPLFRLGIEDSRREHGG